MDASELQSWDIERRADGAVVVRVHSRNPDGCELPDAVFTFRKGDPQYDYWAQQLLARNSSRPERD